MRCVFVAVVAECFNRQMLRNDLSVHDCAVDLMLRSNSLLVQSKALAPYVLPERKGLTNVSDTRQMIDNSEHTAVVVAAGADSPSCTADHLAVKNDGLRRTADKCDI